MQEYQNNDALTNPVVSDEFKDIPIIDMQTYISASQNAEQWTEEAKVECQKVAECLHKFGILLIMDPRVKGQDNEDYLQLMEQYFEKTGAKHASGKNIPEIKPEHLYQTGLMPEYTEIARDHSKLRAEIDLADED